MDVVKHRVVPLRGYADMTQSPSRDLAPLAVVP
jgi:hypothetical protein